MTLRPLMPSRLIESLLVITAFALLAVAADGPSVPRGSSENQTVDDEIAANQTNGMFGSDRSYDRDDDDTRRVLKTDKEWKTLLTRQQYRVTREKDTELPFSGKYWKNKKAGVYRCVCCGAPLFESDAKFDSGTGWPSFSAPIEESCIATAIDHSDFEPRMEVMCSRCDAHLGHVFSDGPAPTGLRFCVNSASLDFEDKSVNAREKHSSAKQARPKTGGKQGNSAGKKPARTSKPTKPKTQAESESGEE